MTGLTDFHKMERGSPLLPYHWVVGIYGKHLIVMGPYKSASEAEQAGTLALTPADKLDDFIVVHLDTNKYNQAINDIKTRLDKVK